MSSVVSTPVAHKTCRTCHQNLPVEFFFRRSSGSEVRRNHCKSCEQVKYRENWLLRAYGVSIDDYKTMYERQKGTCAICKQEGTGKWKDLCVDHCHQTGQVRQLLCNRCNLILGQVGDNVHLLSNLVQYLSHHQKLSLNT